MSLLDALTEQLRLWRDYGEAGTCAHDAQVLIELMHETMSQQIEDLGPTRPTVSLVDALDQAGIPYHRVIMP